MANAAAVVGLNLLQLLQHSSDEATLTVRISLVDNVVSEAE